MLSFITLNTYLGESHMTQARVEQVGLSDVPWSHVVNRCVFLCGVDSIMD